MRLTKSYVKIYGPPVLKSIKALEKVAADMGKKTGMRHYSVLVPTPEISYSTSGSYESMLLGYANSLLTEVELPAEEKVKLLSRSGDTLGEYDFFFEWAESPTKQRVQELIAMIDDVLADCGCRYTVVTK